MTTSDPNNTISQSAMRPVITPQLTTNSNGKLNEDNPQLKLCLCYIDDLIESLQQVEYRKKISYSTKSLRKLESFYHKNKPYRTTIGDELAGTALGKEGFLVNYMEHLTENGNNYPLAPEKRYLFESYDELRRVFWNYTNDSIKFCKELGNHGLISALIYDLKEFQHTYNDTKEKRFIVRSAIGILHNCVVVSENIKYFKEEKASNIIGWYAKNAKDDLEGGFGISFLMTLAYIFDDNDDDGLSVDASSMRSLLKLLEEAVRSSEHLSKSYHAYGADSILRSLTHLASKKANSVYLLQNGILHNVMKMLKSGNDWEKFVAVEAVWALAFADDNKKQILSNTQLITLLREYSEISSQQNSNLNIQSAAKGALWVLERSNKPQSQKVKVCNRKDSKTGHIMISYQWDCQELMLKVNHALKSRGYETWMDVDNMRGSTLEGMAEAVENSSIIIVALSQKYKTSFNCRTEGEYAYQCRKTIIPVLVENRYKADGWLGALITTKLYFNLTTEEKFQIHFPELIKEIDHHKNQENPVAIVEKHNKKDTDVVDSVSAFADDKLKLDAAASVTSVAEWTNDDVSNWFKKNGFKQNLRLYENNLNGKSLLFLKDVKKEAPEFFYRVLTTQLGLENFNDIMEFTKSLDTV